QGRQCGIGSTSDYGGIRSGRAFNNLKLCPDKLNREGKSPEDGGAETFNKG
ncbi:MAG: hypothetical protein Q9204_006636, partial [Flavoplaca sp. TL-2023a]